MVKKCLLIIPKHFYSFHSQFKTQLEGRGYNVMVVNDEFPEGRLGLLMGKLRIPLVKVITYRTYLNTIIPTETFDLVIIFKGRGMSPRLIDLLKKVSKRIIGYNWDSFKFNSSPIEWRNLVDKYCTFDIKDAEQYRLPLVELFTTIDENKLHGKIEKKIKFSAVFRNHSNRLRFLDEVIRHFDIKQEEINIYIFEQNAFFKILNILNSPLLYLKYRKFMHNKPLLYDTYLKTISSSNYTLDYAHPKQTGITMRCFDALNMQTKIITNNIYINSSPSFINTLPIVFNLKNNIHYGTLDFSNEYNFENRRTISDFFDELLK